MTPADVVYEVIDLLKVYPHQTVLGMPDRVPLAINLGVLAGVLIGSLWLVGRRMDWRQQ